MKTPGILVHAIAFKCYNSQEFHLMKLLSNTNNRGSLVIFPVPEQLVLYCSRHRKNISPQDVVARQCYEK